MARENALNKVAEAKARLETANKAQAEIAQQAVEALENGADPKLVETLATEAAKSVVIEERLTPILQEKKENDAAAMARAEVLAKQKLEESVKVKANFERNEPWELIGATLDGTAFVLNFDEHGIAIAAKSVAEYLVTPFSSFSYAE